MNELRTSPSGEWCSPRVLGSELCDLVWGFCHQPGPLGEIVEKVHQESPGMTDNNSKLGKAKGWGGGKAAAILGNGVKYKGGSAWYR